MNEESIKPIRILTVDGRLTGYHMPDNTVVVFKGSYFRNFETNTLLSVYRNIRNYLIRNGYVKNEQLVKDYTFNSECEACCVCYGRQIDGKGMFITEDNVPLKQYLKEEIVPELEKSFADDDDEETKPELIDCDISSVPADEKVVNGVIRFPRNDRTKKIALLNSKDKCAIKDCSHSLFKERNGKTYLEVHHLIPISARKDFPNINIDIPENIVCLCPSCHREIHNGLNAKEMIISLYNEREKLLALKGIVLKEGIKQLLSYYNIK